MFKILVTFLFVCTCYLITPLPLNGAEVYPEKLISKNNEAIRKHITYSEIDSIEALLVQNLKNIKGLSPRMQAETYFLAGEYYYLISDVEEAKRYYSLSLVKHMICFGKKSSKTALVYSSLGKYYNFKRLADSAFYTTSLAKSIFLKSDDKDSIDGSAIYCNYAYAYKIYLRDAAFDRVYDSTRYFYNCALRFAKNEISKAHILHQIGNTYTDEVFTKKQSNQSFHKAFLKANSYYDKSRELFAKVLGSRNSSISNLYYTKALLYKYAYENDSINSMIKFLDTAVSCLSTNLGLNKNHSASFNGSSDPYLLITLLNKKCQYLEEAAKNKSISELSVILHTSELAIKIWDKILLRYKSKHVHRLLNIYSEVPFQYAVFSALDIFDITSNKKFIEIAFFYSDRSKYSGMSDKNYRNSNFLDSIQYKLKTDEAVIEYFNSSSNGVAFVISRGHLNSHRFIPSQGLSKSKDDYLSNIVSRNTENYIAAANSLYKTLFEPLEKFLKNAHYIKIIPHDQLTLIPFEALLYNKSPEKDFRKLNYLINKYDISYALGTNWLNQPVISRKANFSYLTPFKNEGSLAFSSETTKQLSEKYISTEIQAQEQMFVNTKILHIATHGAFNGADFNSGFFMDSSFSKMFTIPEIQSVNIEADLCILLSCESGIGKYEEGEGSMTFQRALLRSGTFNSISTLWKVDDFSSSAIINNFYKYLESKNASSALTSAKKTYIFNCEASLEAHPYYWAGISYTGSSINIELEKNNSWINYLWCSSFLIVPVYYIRKRRKA